MKITQSHQDKLESLMTENTPSGMENFVKWHKEQVRLGFIKPISCAATNCMSHLFKGEALKFVCDEIYSYANDDHIRTFFKKLYKKYS